ncbi:MAG: hypothetical protein ACJAYE_002352 [Candidatus Azotimanducaceae bacterium]|jgi:hypothetical protein
MRGLSFCRLLSGIRSGIGLVLLALVAVNASANPFDHSDRGSFRTAEFQPPPQHSILPRRSESRAGSKKAASRAKQSFPQSKILSVQPMQSNGNQYRVKLLSSGGVVKYVFVDANSGEVFDE